MALPRKVIDTESALGIDNGAIQSAIPLGIAPGANEIVYVDGVIGDGSFSDPFSGGDFDYYSVYIGADTLFTAALYGSQWGTGLDAKIDILDASGNTVSTSDDYGSLDPLAQAFRSTGGIYIIRVSNYLNSQSSLFDSSSGNGNGAGQLNGYRLYIGTGPSVTINASPNDANSVTGDTNANIIDGGRNADIINGGDGDDVLNGGYGDDTVTGGIGNDTFLWNIDSSAAQVDTYDLGTGGDEIVDVHSPLAANTIAFVNDQFVISGNNQLTLSGSSNSYTVNIYGGSGIDTITATGITNTVCRTNLFGGDGGDTLLGSGGNRMSLNGGEGSDKLITGSATPIAGLDMVGGNGDDTYVITNASVFLIDRVGEGTGDRVQASVNFGLINGNFVQIEFLETTNETGTAAIDLSGNLFAQTIKGNAGMNKLDGGVDSVADTLIGGLGNDTYIIRTTTDNITEAFAAVNAVTNADRAKAAVSFTLAAGDNIEFLETVLASAGTAINLTGNEIAQTVTGNAGSNILNGKGGNDILTGGAGNDFFVFNTALNATTNRDTITDFSATAVGNNDAIRLENTGAGLFNTLAVGTLNAAFFKANATGTATDANDRIIYETDTGKLFYDSNGSAAGGSIHFATLSNAVKPVLTNFDFFVI